MSWSNAFSQNQNHALSDCLVCNGSGKQANSMFDLKCQACNGSGKSSLFGTDLFAEELPNSYPWKKKCPHCQGQKWVYITAHNSLLRGSKKQTCQRCRGIGVV